jgi:hypothetical protein
MAKTTETTHFVFHFLALAIIAALSWTLLVMEKENMALKIKPWTPISCPAVAVTCECPEYEEGWDDAQFAQGCDPSAQEMPIDDIKLICAELDEYGYVPGC